MKSPPPELARRLDEASEEILRPGRSPRLEEIAGVLPHDRTR